MDGLSAMLPLRLGLGNDDSPNARSRDQQPTEAHKAFIPETLHGKVITLSSTDLDMCSNMKTVYIGIESGAFTKSMWDDDVKRWRERFTMLQINEIELKMHEQHDLKGTLDTARAITEIQRALQMINTVPCGSPIRIICVGPGVTRLLPDAITYLIKEWLTPDNKPRDATDKVLHIVTSGDSDKCSLFDLSKRLCLTGICKSIQFFDTQEYHPFGHYKKSYFLK